MKNSENEIQYIIKEYWVYVKVIAFKYVPVPSAVDDIVQKVFYELITNKEKFDLKQNPKALLYTITKNISKRHWHEVQRTLKLNNKKLVEHIRELSEDKSIDPEEDRKNALQACMKKLPEKSRKLLEFKYFLNKKSYEIGDHLNMKSAAVRKALLRIRNKLKECIEDKLKEGQHA